MATKSLLTIGPCIDAKPVVNLPSRNPANDVDSIAMSVEIPVDQNQTGSDTSAFRMHSETFNDSSNLDITQETKVHPSDSQVSITTSIDGIKATDRETGSIVMPISTEILENKAPEIEHLTSEGPRTSKPKNIRKKPKNFDLPSSSGPTMDKIAGSVTKKKKKQASNASRQKKSGSPSLYEANTTVDTGEGEIHSAQRRASMVSLPASKITKQRPKHHQTKSLADLPSEATQKIRALENSRSRIPTCGPTTLNSWQENLENYNSPSADGTFCKPSSKERSGSRKSSSTRPTSSERANSSSTIQGPSRENPVPQKEHTPNLEACPTLDGIDLAFTDESQWPALGSTEGRATLVTHSKRLPTQSPRRTSSISDSRSNTRRK